MKITNSRGDNPWLTRSFWIMVERYRADQAGIRAQANLSVYFG